MGEVWSAVVPSSGLVQVEVVVTAGQSLDLVLEGPGACSGVAIEVPDPSALPYRVLLDCGWIHATNLEVGIDTLLGVAQGRLTWYGLQADV
jgi:hypothetical protein